MTKADVKQWFDAILEAKEKFNKLQEVYSISDGVLGSESMNKRIHIYRGIEKLSAIMEIPLEKGTFECDGIKMDRFSFMYMGIEVFQLGESEEK